MGVSFSKVVAALMLVVEDKELKKEIVKIVSLRWKQVGSRD
jgi:hypothetical protein